MVVSSMLRYQRNHVVGCKSGDSCKKCPFWIQGRHDGKRWHQSLKTTDSRTAAQLVQRVIITGKLDTEPERPKDNGITLADAITKFYNELSGRAAKRRNYQALSQVPGRIAQPSQA